MGIFDNLKKLVDDHKEDIQKAVDYLGSLPIKNNAILYEKDGNKVRFFEILSVDDKGVIKIRKLDDDGHKPIEKIYIHKGKEVGVETIRGLMGKPISWSPGTLIGRSNRNNDLSDLARNLSDL